MKLFETSKYIAKYVCIKCEHVLSRYEVMYSHGICPYCGNNDKSTICAVSKITVLKTTWIELTIKPPFIKRITNEKIH